MRRSLCILLFLLTGVLVRFQSFAQNQHTIDSLERSLKRAASDTERVGIHIELASQYLLKDLEQTSAHLDRGEQLAKKAGYRQKDPSIANLRGLVLLYQGLPQKAFQQLQTAEKLAEKHKDSVLLGRIYSNLAMTLAQLKSFEQAVAYYRKGERLNKKIKNEANLAKIYNNLGALYQDVGEQDTALYYHEAALAIRSRLSDSIGIAYSLYNIGAIYSAIGRPEKSIQHYVQAARIFEKENQYGNLTQVYNSISGVNTKLENYDEALVYNALALEYAEKSGIASLIPEIYLHKGLCLTRLKRYKEARKTLNKAIEKGVETYNFNVASEAHLLLGIAAMEEQKPDQAKSHFAYAIEYAEKSGFGRIITLAKQKFAEYKILTNDTTGLRALLDELEVLNAPNKGTLAYRDHLRLMTQYYILTGKPESALSYFRQINELMDTVLSSSLLEDFANYQTKYETAKKEQEILSLHHTKEINELKLKQKNLQLGGILVAMAFFAVGIYLYNKRKKEQHRLEMRLLELQEKEERARLVQETERIERKRIAQDLHDELGSGMSKIVLSCALAKNQVKQNEWLHTCFLSIDKTVSELSGNMKALIWSLDNDKADLDVLLAKMREFTGDFLENSPIAVSYDSPETAQKISVRKESLRDIFLSFKEAINNVVKHAHATTISIQVKLDDAALSIQVADNGQGIPSSKSSGNGLRNMRARMERQGGRFDVVSQPGIGTTISFQIQIADISVANESNEPIEALG